MIKSINSGNNKPKKKFFNDLMKLHNENKALKDKEKLKENLIKWKNIKDDLKKRKKILDKLKRYKENEIKKNDYSSLLNLIIFTIIIYINSLWTILRKREIMKKIN